MPTEGAAAREPQIGALARADVPTCRLDEPIGDVARRAREAGFQLGVVVSQEQVVLGLVDGEALSRAPDTPVEQAMRPGPTTLRPNLAVDAARDFLRESRRERALVTTPDGVLIGLLERADVERMAVHPGVMARG